MGFKKSYLKSKPECKVTFKLPKEIVGDGQKIIITGDFTDWSREEKEMNKLKTGDCTVVISLESGREYQFRYLIDGYRWENDPEADRYEPNGFSGVNSVIVV